MTSRTEKYYTENQTTTSTRSSRNERLYREVYGKYDNSDNLPLEDNTNEIDMAKLKELVLNSSKQEEKELSQTKEHFSMLEQRKRNIDEQKLYDINKILEKAKYENNKLKETTTSLPKIDKSILSTLRGTELTIPEIKEANQNYDMREEKIELEKKEQEIEEQLSMTREIKYHNLVEEEPTSSKTTDLSLDLFSELKPIGNTIITKPIKEDNDNGISKTKNYSSDFRSNDTSDIDIIKPAVPTNTNENDFFTSSYEFSKKDFAYDDDFYEANQKGSILKVILLILSIFIVVGVITYFIINYGIGIS